MRIGHMSARKGVTAAVLTVAGIVALTTTSLALFTETETVGANTFSVGTIDLTAAPTSAAITFSAMAPGDQVTAALTITNAGDAGTALCGHQHDDGERPGRTAGFHNQGRSHHVYYRRFRHRWDGRLRNG